MRSRLPRWSSRARPDLPRFDFSELLKQRAWANGVPWVGMVQQSQQPVADADFDLPGPLFCAWHCASSRGHVSGMRMWIKLTRKQADIRGLPLDGSLWQRLHRAMIEGITKRDAHAS